MTTTVDKSLTVEAFLNAFDTGLLNSVKNEIRTVEKENPAFDHLRAVAWAIEGVSEARELPGEIINSLREYFEDGDTDEAESRYFESQLRAIEQRTADRPEDVDTFYARAEQDDPEEIEDNGLQPRYLNRRATV